MPYVSYRRADAVAPGYSLPAAVQHRLTSARPGMTPGRNVRFRYTFSRASHRPRTRVQTSDGASPPGPSATTVWPAALALMLVANLVPPAASFVPKTSPRCDDAAPSGERHDDCSRAQAVTSESVASVDSDADVIAQPVAPQVSIKRGYTSQDVLRSIGSGSEPFKNFGESVADIYALLTGQEFSPQTREDIEQRAHLVDIATGLIPEVAILRVPSEVTDVVADGIEGKRISTDRIVSILQSADPRVMTRALGNAIRPVRPAPAVRPALPAPPAPHAPPARPAPPGRAVLPGRQGATGRAPQTTPDKPVGGGASHHLEQAPQKTVDAVDRKVASGVRELAMENAGIDDDASAEAGVAAELPAPLTITSEHIYLQGYAQPLALERLPAGGGGRMVVVDGRHYLRGEAGYYLATRSHSEDHWLIDAAQHPLARVPVTYDRKTGRWEAHAPLGPCSVGDRRATAPDSIALNRHDVDAVLSHLRDDDVQNAIAGAYAEVSRMARMRSDRADRRAHDVYDARGTYGTYDASDESAILRHRDVVRVVLEHAPPGASLLDRQRLAAFVTASHYRLNPAAEAFCQENAEILFHFLIEGGVHGECLRMITVRPKHRAPHVLVLYTASEELIDALELATPVDAEGSGGDGLGVDGITGTNFAGLIMSAQDSTVLLDPWSRVKAVGFALTKDPMETRSVLDAAFADIGHRPGEAYTVSLTRPVGPRRRRAGRAGSPPGSASPSRSQGSTNGSTRVTSSEATTGGSTSGSSSGYGSSRSPDAGDTGDAGDTVESAAFVESTRLPPTSAGEAVRRA
ncbi:hypothetical protein [Pandoraea anhela]|uniref:Uncharacterized protein n=1 Tax=Pandoraea anhela TaxID=2508295 RepID=A0A5E4SEH5_9BURK|nr:hypothetical protein [Pandoraea anhela]VVD73695.1 hypothetical protein PAN31108_00734 [Pandoraea anhela]